MKPIKTLEPAGVYDTMVYDEPHPRGDAVVTDGFMSIAFDVGTLAPGEETTLSFLTSLDGRPYTETLQDLHDAVKPVLTLDQMKCCAVPPQPLIDGGNPCEQK